MHNNISTVVKPDGSRVVVRTALVEEQAAALHVVCFLASKLQHLMYPFVSRLCQALTLLLNREQYHEEVQEYGITAAAELVLCVARRSSFDPEAQKAGAVAQVLSFLFNTVTNSLQDENLEVLECCFQGLRDGLVYAHFDYSTLGSGNFDVTSFSDEGFKHVEAGQAMFPESQIEPLIEIAIASLSSSHQRRAVRRAEAKVLSEDGDYDDECAEEDFGVSQQEEQLQVLIAEFLRVLAKLYGDRWLGLDVVRSTLIPNLFNMGQPHAERCDKKFAVMVLVDVLEFVIPFCDSGAQSHFIGNLMGVLAMGLQLSKEQDEEYLEAATHGVVLVAGKYPNLLSDEVKKLCMVIVDSPDEVAWMRRGVSNARVALQVVGLRAV